MRVSIPVWYNLEAKAHFQENFEKSVSIPVWYNLEFETAKIHNNVIYVSIPVWYNLESSELARQILDIKFQFQCGTI